MIAWIDAPGCEGTVANGVGADGLVVGVAREPSGRVRGFLLAERDDAPRFFDAPDATDTFLQDADDGVVMGDAVVGGASACFALRGGDLQAIAPPGAAQAWGGGMLANGNCCGSMVNAAGRRVGFRRLGGRFDEVLPAGAESVVLHGMGEGGEVVGACSLGGQLGGFLLRPDGRMEWLDPPRGEFVPSDCADDGSWIVGWFIERGGLCVAGELRDGRWHSVEIPGGPWLESAIVGCRIGVGMAGWALGGDGHKRGFVLTREAP